MLCFSRDCEILQQLKNSIGNPLTVTIKGKHTSADSTTVFPPSGVIPFHGFTMYGKEPLRSYFETALSTPRQVFIALSKNLRFDFFFYSCVYD